MFNEIWDFYFFMIITSSPINYTNYAPFPILHISI